jgi:hypothetical protein
VTCESIRVRACDIRVGMIVLDEGYPCDVIRITRRDGQLLFHFSDAPGDHLPAHPDHEIAIHPSPAALAVGSP